MKSNWIRLLAIMLVTLMAMTSASAETNEGIELNIDSDEMDIIVEPVDEVVPEEVDLTLGEIELPELGDLDGSTDDMLMDSVEPTDIMANDGVSEDFEIENGVLVSYRGNGGDVVIPDGVTSIGGNAFSGCTSLTSVTIPDSVTGIGKYAFWNCDSLASVTILSKNISIFDDSFDEYNPITFYVCCSSSAIKSLKSSFGYIYKYKIILLHSEIIDPYVEPTYFEPGKTEGSHCSECGIVLKAQEVLPAISLTQTSLSMKAGDSVDLAVTSQGNRTVTWSSSDIAVAAVTDGTVTALGEGECTITAAFSDRMSLTCQVTVTDPAALYKYDDYYWSDSSYKNPIKKASLYGVGDTFQLYVTYKNGRTVDWSSSNDSIATVNKDGLITAIGGGTCTVTAAFKGGKSLSCEVNVTDYAELSKTALSLKYGETATLTVSNLEGRTVTWSSSNTAVATVKNGKVNAIKAGKCTITATLSNGRALSCEVTVSDPAKLSKVTLSLNVGETSTLSVSNLAGRTIAWSSSDKAVASVIDGKVTAIGEGKCIITAALSDGTTFTCSVTVKDGAAISDSTLSLFMGETYELTIDGIAGRKVTWSSSNTAIATVNNGTVKAIKVGKCTITAKVKDGKTLKCALTVTDGAKLSEARLSLKAGKTATLTVSNLAGRKVTWSSSNKNVATVKAGTVTATGGGKCTITAKVANGKTLTCAVTVTDRAKLYRYDSESKYYDWYYDYSSVSEYYEKECTPIKSASLDIGQPLKLIVTYTAGRKVIWSSSNTRVATVNKGKVTPTGGGKCTITAKVGGKTLSCKLTVTDTARLSETTLTLNAGDTHKLTIDKLAGRAVTWSSSNKKVATVKDGKVTAIYMGKCTITAKVKNGKTYTCKVTVTDPAKLSKTSLTLLVGKTSTLKVSGIKGRTVTWSSSNKNVATVDRGKVKAVAAGKCDIIAKVGNTKLICAVAVTKPLTGDIHSILGKNRNSINKRLSDKLRYYEDDAYTNDFFLVQTDDSDDIISIALLTDAESDIGKYTLYGLYPGMSYQKACKLLTEKGWKLDSESYDNSYFYNPKNSNVYFYVTIINDEIDLIVYAYT